MATPDKIQFANALPKTRSGKIMRRILTNITDGKVGELGDTTTLADPSVVEQLVREKNELPRVCAMLQNFPCHVCIEEAKGPSCGLGGFLQ